jgi:hypothetical protein
VGAERAGRWKEWKNKVRNGVSRQFYSQQVKQRGSVLGTLAEDALGWKAVELSSAVDVFANVGDVSDSNFPANQGQSACFSADCAALSQLCGVSDDDGPCAPVAI